MENKQKICNLLCETLKATRNQEDLKLIRYEEVSQNYQRVIIEYENGSCGSVNVSMDSGIAMIYDILNAIY